jgi:regulator of protease activity HflC (stomatin/prohibitin superfamily)
MKMVEQLIEHRRRAHRLDKFIVFALAIGLIFFILWRSIFVAIPPGNAAVLFRLFGGGTDTSRVYREGLMIKWPWDSYYVYEIRTQARNYSVDALSANGLTVRVDFTALFNPLPRQLPILQKQFGPEYVDRLVTPVSLDAVRQVIAQYNPQTLNTTEPAIVQEQILQRLQNDPPISNLLSEGVVIRALRLPDTLNAAINAKLTEEQYEQAYDFRIDREKKEALRKHIEAVGIQNFYSIVASSLTPSLLTWRGIEATVEVSRSPNSKIVIMGGGKNQLPLILGSEISGLPSSPSPPPGQTGAYPLPDLRTLPSLFPNMDMSSSGSGVSKSVLGTDEKPTPTEEKATEPSRPDMNGKKVTPPPAKASKKSTQVP